MKNITFSVPGTQHKHVEAQVNRDDRTDFQIRFNLTTKDDHAGINVYLSIGHMNFSASLYDDRHWDYDNDCWMVYKRDKK